MDNLPRNRLTWQYKGKRAILKKDDEAIAGLREKRKKRASFKWGGKTYTISNTGYWNPVTLLEEDGKEIMRMKRSSRINKGSIEFKEGGKYLLIFRNPSLVKLSICNLSHQELLAYRLLSKTKAAFKTAAGLAGIPENEGMLLILFASFVFRSVVRENGVVAVKNILFAKHAGEDDLPEATTNAEMKEQTSQEVEA